MIESKTTESDIESKLMELSKLGYRFTRPLQFRHKFSDKAPPEKIIKAVILDTETTGLNQMTDKIIELGMIKFDFCPVSGQVYNIIDSFNELEDPDFPIPPETTKVNGIDDTMVKGKVIDNFEVKNFLQDVRVVIAHNAGFDRPFVEERFPFFADLPWFCSLSQIDWREEGIGSAKQEYLAYTFGFHYEGHRASNDCEALLEILQSTFPNSGKLVMKHFLENILRKIK